MPIRKKKNFLAQKVLTVFVILLTFFFDGQTFAQQSKFSLDTFLKNDHKKALILIKVTGQTASGETASNQGTAFFVTNDGFALTAAHLFFKDSVVNSPNNKIFDPGDGTHLLGSIGSSGSAPVQFEFMDYDIKLDIALIKLRDPPSPQIALEFCAAVPSIDQDLVALGFAGNSNLVAPQGKRLGDLQQVRYPVYIDINPGMSGGPVISDTGKVFAMSVAGFREDGFQGYNFILPLVFAQLILKEAQITEKCSAENRQPDFTSLRLQYISLIQSINGEIIEKGRIINEFEEYIADPTDDMWRQIKSDSLTLFNHIRKSISASIEYDSQFVGAGEGEILLVTSGLTQSVDQSFANSFATTRKVWDGRIFVLQHVTEFHRGPSKEQARKMRDELLIGADKLTRQLEQLVKSIPVGSN